MRSLLVIGLVLALGCGGGGDDEVADDEPGGTSCGGFAGATCNGQEFCDHADDRCAAADGAGVCAARPSVCTPVIEAVCGCDGKRYNNVCEAQRAGTDVSESESCDP